MIQLRSNIWTKKFFAVISMMLLFFTATAAPRSEKEMVLSGSWIYDALTEISLESGTVNFADCAPLSIEEIKVYLGEIKYDSLSDVGKRQYDRIIAYFAKDNWSADCGIASLGIEPSVNIEGQYKSNDDVNWIYDRYSRKPFIDMPLTLSFANYVSLYSDFVLSQNKYAMALDDNYTNILISTSYFDINFPHTTYLSTGYQFTDTAGMAFQIGSGTQSVGRTLTGSCILSDYMTGASYANLTFYTPNIKWVTDVIQLNVNRYYYSHRMDVRFFKKLTFSILEGTLTYAPLELRYLNPFTIYHGSTPWRDYGSNDSHNGELMAFKVQFTPCKNLSIYGIFAQDQFQTLYERTNWPDDETPNGLCGQLGAESFIPMGNGYIHLALEGYYADPYCYIKQSPNWSFVRTYSENIGDPTKAYYEWMGSPFGPDTIAGEITGGYALPEKWEVNITLLSLLRGQYADDSIFSTCGWGGTNLTLNDDNLGTSWIYPVSSDPDYLSKRDATTPTGDNPEWVNRFTVSGTFYPTASVSLSLQPGYTFIYNNSHHAGEIAQGFEIVLSATWKPTETFNFHWNMGN
jgi:hypothetical protein